MTVKELFVADLQATLEETANLMADRVILEALAKHGKITIEEAEFYDALVRRVVTEAAEEFVPERLPVEQFIQEAGEPMILTGEDGTVYSFDPATCELTPIDAGEEGDMEVAPEMGGAPMAESEEAGEEAGELVEEASEKASEKASEEIVEESETTDEELTESQMIVSNLIKSLGA